MTGTYNQRGSCCGSVPIKNLFSRRRGSICALCIFLDQATNLFELAGAPRTCFALAQTTNGLPCARNVRRSDPRQSRTASGKRVVASTTHYLAPTDQATCLQKVGSASSRAPSKDGPNLETGTLPGPARDSSPLAPGAFSLVLEAQISGAGEEAEALSSDNCVGQID